MIVNLTNDEVDAILEILNQVYSDAGFYPDLPDRHIGTALDARAKILRVKDGHDVYDLREQPVQCSHNIVRRALQRVYNRIPFR